MTKFVYLTFIGGEKVWVNPNQVAFFATDPDHGDGTGTQIKTALETWLHVKEPVDEVATIMESRNCDCC